MYDKLLNLKETAKVLGVHRATLSNWLSAGRISLPYTKICNVYHFKESDVIEMLKRITIENKEFPSREG